MDTISAMRGQLETMRYEQERNIQRAVADAAGEVEQLRSTIISLREELERRSAEFDARLADERLAHHNELRELQETIQSLRENLTGKKETSAS